MPTHRSGHRPAGGLHSRQTIHKPQPKVEPRAKAINPAGVSHIGISQFLGREPLERGPGYNAPAVERGTGWVEPRPLTKQPGIDLIDQMVENATARERIAQADEHIRAALARKEYEEKFKKEQPKKD